MKIHYAPYGEWGSERTTCVRFYTSNSAITGNKEKVTCCFCLKIINKLNTPAKDGNKEG